MTASTAPERQVWSDWPLILAYHSVSDVRTDDLAVRATDFEYQLTWLRDHGYRSMTLAQFMGGAVSRGERVVIITFDDGYADNYTVAFPILKRFGFVATAFLVSDYVGSNSVFWWDEANLETPSVREHYRLIAWDQVLEMADYGIEFGSHTCTHRLLTRLSAEERWDELARSRTDIGSRLGRDVTSLCYPSGDVDPAVIELAREAGYGCAVVSLGRRSVPLCQYSLRRVGIYHSTSPWLLRLKMAPIVRRNYERLTWRPWVRAPARPAMPLKLSNN